MTDLAAPAGTSIGATTRERAPAGEDAALDLLFWLMVLSSPAPAEEDGPAARLTTRERQIAVLVCRGLTNKEIGRDLAISPSTVKNHMHAIHSKLGIDRRTKLPDALRGVPAC
jgi:DNA-binding NarL/FixJ family response regulator